MQDYEDIARIIYRALIAIYWFSKFIREFGEAKKSSRRKKRR